jgi:hypothetical protein
MLLTKLATAEAGGGGGRLPGGSNAVHVAATWLGSRTALLEALSEVSPEALLAKDDTGS